MNMGVRRVDSRGMWGWTRACGLVLAVAAATAWAGPLVPPAGPVAGTAKPLGEIEPRTAINAENTPGGLTETYLITAPGSYYLTGNVQGEDGKTGLVIAASNVTIDLNGFTMTGPSGGAPVAGIESLIANLEGIRIHDGIISGWGASGVQLGTALAADVRRVHAAANGGSGIDAGAHAVVADCHATRNAGAGISVGIAGRVRGSVASNNGTDGLVLADRAVAEDCSAIGSGQNGFTAAERTTVTRCRADANRVHGISFGLGARVTFNQCTLNGSGPALGAGVFGAATANNALITDNHCNQFNDHAYWVTGTGCIVARNVGGQSNFENYKVVNNNRLATLVFAALNAGANGNTGGGSPGTTDPQANFSY